jgi:flagellar protein FlbD
MIQVTRLDRAPVFLNSDLIGHIEVMPDTVIVLTTGQSLRVREPAEEVVARIIDFRRNIQQPFVESHACKAATSPESATVVSR